MSKDKWYMIIDLVVLSSIAGLILWSQSKDIFSFAILVGAILGVLNIGLNYRKGSLIEISWIRLAIGSLMVFGSITGSILAPFRISSIPFAYYLLLMVLMLGWLLLPLRASLSKPVEYFSFDLLMLVFSVILIVLSL
ncbi:MAG: hypothetical protein D6732_01005 [Methanobacteriota archaeon]|nr:MAG: hypothetical protein D6732_01005 [Euryarchaeota archaeon]